MKTKKIPDLKKCSCGHPPQIIRGTHNILEKKIFSVACKNEQCKSKPKTEDCFTLREAKKQWNTDFVTDYLF